MRSPFARGWTVLRTVAAAAVTALVASLLVAFPAAPAFASTTPGSPSGVSGSPGDGQVAVSWLAPVSDGGSAITGYTVTSSPGGFTATTTGATSATVTGLTDDTPYTFTVSATNGIGTSVGSAPSAAVTPVGVLVANSAEGGTAGTTVTASNSGGGSGSAFTTVARGTGAALTFATAAATHGLLGYSLTGSSGTATYVGWTGLSTTSAAVRFYYNPGSTLPSTVLRLADIRNSTGTAARIELSAANQLFVQNTAGTTVKTFPTALSANTWYRIEFAISVSGTAATINGAYYLADSTTPVDPAYATTTGNTGTAVITQTLVGSTASATWTGTSSFDDIATRIHTTTYIGPSSPPAAPTGVVGTPGNGQVTVNWSAPTNTGSAAITGYTVRSSPGGFSATTTGATSAVVTGLTNGTAYTFSVTATNTVGSSAASGASGSVTPATVPAAPTAVTATASNAQASVSWTAPASNGGSAITGYTVTASPGGATATTTGATNAVVTGLTNGTAYTFTVTATNAVGTGATSAPSSSVTPAAVVPGAPTAVTATAGNTQASVSWTAPASNGGSAITGYTVTSSPGSFTATTTGATTATVTGLTNGTSYTFTVTAANAIGTSAASSPSAAIVPAVGAVSNSAEGGTAGTTVTVANSGGASGDAFGTVTRGTGASLVYATGAAAHGTLGYSLTSATGTSTSVSWSGYNATSAAVRFSYNPGPTLPSTTVRLLDVRNSAGTAARILVSSANKLIVQNSAGTTLTTFPTTLAVNTWYRIELAISISGTAATINAAYYSKDGTTPIDTAYTTTSGNTGTANISTVSVGSTSSATWGGTEYFDDVAVQPGTTSYIGPVPTAPGAPTAVTATAGDSQASVSWTAPASNGGRAITGYTVTASPGGATATTTGATTATVTGLTNGTAYTFTVTATNAVGVSAASAASAAVTPQVATSPPSFTTGAVSTLVGNGTATTAAGVGTSATLNGATGVAVIGTHLYTATSDAILDTNTSTGVTTVLAGTPGTPGCTDGATGSVATIGASRGLVTDGSMLYISAGCGIRIINPTTGATSTLWGTSQYAAVTAPGNGLLYAVAGTAVFSIDPLTDAASTIATFADGACNRGTFPEITGNSQMLYVVVNDFDCNGDPYDYRIASVNLAAGNTYTDWLPGTAGMGQYGGLSLIGNDLFTAAYIAYGLGNGRNAAGPRLLRFSLLDGTSSQVAGSSGGFNDGTGTDAWFGSINAVASDAGALYVADSANNRVRRVVATTALPSAPPTWPDTATTFDAGAVYPVIGNGQPTTTTGTWSSAGTSAPHGVAVFGTTAYVSDADAMSKIDLTTGTTTILAGTPGTPGGQDGVSGATSLVSAEQLATDGYYLYSIGGLVRRTNIATGATTVVGAGPDNYNILQYGTLGPDGNIYATNNAGGIIKMNPTTGAFVQLPITVPTPGCEGPAVSGIAVDSTTVYIVGSAESCGDYFNYNNFIDSFSLADGHLIAQDIFDGTVVRGSTIAAVGDSIYYSDYTGNQENLYRIGKSLAGSAVVVASGVPMITSISSDGTRLFIASADSNSVYAVIPAQSAPLAAGGPTRVGETWGCGPSSELATAPACTDFVDPATGSGVQSATDLAVGGRGPGLVWARAYDSQATGYDGILGHGWANSYGMNVTVDPYNGTVPLATSPVVDVTEENGSRLSFVRNSDGTYSAASRVQATLTQNSDGTWTFVRAATQIFTFDTTGLLAAVKDLNGYATTLSYVSGQLMQVTDTSGRTLSFTYWPSGKVETVTDPLGRMYSYAYDGNDNLTSVTDPQGLVTTYGYDASHNLTSVLRPLGAAATPALGTATSYDVAHRVTSHADAIGRTTHIAYSAPTAPGSFTETRTDPMGVVSVDVYTGGELMSSTAAFGTTSAATTSYTYDPVSNGVTSVTDPLMKVSRATYDARGNKLTSTDANANETFYTYDALNDVLTVKDPLGVTTTNTYDAVGNPLTSSRPLNGTPVVTAGTSNTYGDSSHPGDVTASTDANGKVTQYFYDVYGNKTTTLDPLLHKTTATYDLDGEQLTQVAPDGYATGANPADFTTTTTYWQDGQKDTVTDPLTHVTTYVYDADGNPWKVTDATHLTTTSLYDAADQLTSVTNPDGTSTSYTYDLDGRTYTAADNGGNTTTYGYDPRGDQTSVQDPALKVTSATYDLAGRKATSTTANMDVTYYTYDDGGRLTHVTTPLGTTIYGYDLDGHQTSVKDPDTNLTTYDFDSLGRQTTTHRPDLTTVVNGYDLDGHLTSYTDALTKTTSYGYDDAGRQTTRTDPDLRLTQYGYDASNQPTTTTDPTTRVTTNVYDNAGRLTNITYSDGVTPNVTYTYDDANRPLTMVDGTGTTNYGHDPYGRVTSVSNGAGNAVGYGYDTLGRISTITYPGTSHVVTRGYDADSRLHTLTDWNSNQTVFGYDGDSNLTTTTYPNGVVDTTTIGAADTVTSVGVANGGTTLGSFGYTYTPSGMVAATTDSIAPLPTRAYGYNALHQLTGLDTQTSAYGHDNAGNLKTLPNGATMSYDAAGQVGTLTPTAGPATTFGFDGIGNRTSAATTGSPTVGYTYNQASELTTSTNTPGGNATYTYNGDGLRASTTDNVGTHPSTWDALSASLPLLIGDGTNYYLYGPTDKVIEQINATTGTTTYLHQDRNGSTRLITNTSGAVVGTKSYDPYGNILATTGTATSPFGYTGQYTDPSGLIYLRARYYDPATGQFLTRDPLVDATQQPYTYAGGDPTNATDPAGLAGTSTSNCGPTTVCGEIMADKAIFDDGSSPAPDDGLPHSLGDVWHEGWSRTTSDAEQAVVGFGDSFTGGLTSHIANRISPGASKTVPHGSSYLTGSILGFAASIEDAPADAVRATRLAAEDSAATARGLSSHGGVLSSEVNQAEGTVWTSSGAISQNDVAPIVNSGMYGGDVNVIGGVHGLPNGSTIVDSSLYENDVARFGNLPGVSVYNLPDLSPTEITTLLRGPGTTIGAFCDSAACLAPFR